MNREQKRMMQRQGQVGADGTPRRAVPQRKNVQRRRRQRTGPPVFREIREEMRQVSWPPGPRSSNYTLIVFFVLVFMTSLIFGLATAFPSSSRSSSRSKANHERY